jgi:hypothetical protein
MKDFFETAAFAILLLACVLFGFVMGWCANKLEDKLLPPKPEFKYVPEQPKAMTQLWIPK